MSGRVTLTVVPASVVASAVVGAAVVGAAVVGAAVVGAAVVGLNLSSEGSVISGFAKLMLRMCKL